MAMNVNEIDNLLGRTNFNKTHHKMASIGSHPETTKNHLRDMFNCWFLKLQLVAVVFERHKFPVGIIVANANDGSS